MCKTEGMIVKRSIYGLIWMPIHSRVVNKIKKALFKKNKIHIFVFLLLPLIMIIGAIIIERPPNWEIAFIPYTLFVLFLSFFLWFFKSEKRKTFLLLTFGIIFLIISISIALANTNRIINSYFTRGTIVYFSPKISAGKSYVHDIKVSFINKNGKKVIFEDIIGHPTIFRLGSPIKVISPHKDMSNPEVYIPGDVWLPFLFFFLFSLGSFLKLIYNNRKKRPNRNRKIKKKRHKGRNF